MDAATPAPAGALQFDTAEPAPQAAASGKACTACKTPIQNVYHMANGQVICPGCRIRLEGAGQADEGPAVRFFRAALYGAGAAVAGTIIYALMLLTGWNLALVAILVGFMVGRAVQVGSRERGGWPYQLLAVGLTYMSIVTSFVPTIVSGMRRGGDMSDVPVVFQYLVGFFLAIPMPFLIITTDFLTVVILAIGLYQAWKQTQRRELNLTGPYHVKSPAPAPAFGAPAVG